MRNRFSWYFNASDAEISHIWKNGILTVDANVLLDLYRYHESTRNSLLDSLENFEGKLWLSHQATEEFFRNRTKVIISSEKTFKQAKDEIEKLRNNFESAVSQLRGNRIIPAEVADNLLQQVTPIINDAQDKIAIANNDYPKFLQEDPILEKISQIFEGAIGESIKEEQLAELSIEAERRKNNKIPPGYLDNDKDGDRPYGDFFLWRQILQHSKIENTPVIFVTSERKEDWWEKLAGKTIGPRPELLREAHEYSGQRILIYQTDRFLEYASQLSGTLIDDSAVEEIRAIDTLRSEKENAVEVIAQNANAYTEFLHKGRLKLQLHRPVRNLTGSGHFEPRMYTVPILEVTLVSSPKDTPKHRLNAGTGTNYDFNIHIISNENGTLLPVGEYIFEYIAKCEKDFNEEELEINAIGCDAENQHKQIIAT